MENYQSSALYNMQSTEPNHSTYGFQYSSCYPGGYLNQFFPYYENTATLETNSSLMHNRQSNAYAASYLTPPFSPVSPSTSFNSSNSSLNTSYYLPANNCLQFQMFPSPINNAEKSNSTKHSPVSLYQEPMHPSKKIDSTTPNQSISDIPKAEYSNLMTNKTNTSFITPELMSIEGI